MKTNRWILVGVGAALLLSACGDGSTATTSTVLTIDSTAYHTLPPTQSTAPPAGGSTPAGGTSTDVSEYTVQKGDVQFSVAKQFGVTLDALNLANADTSGYNAFYVGLKIKIPAGAVVPTNTTAPPTGAQTTQPTTPAQSTTTLAGGGSNCAQGSYTIVSGDIPSAVAKKFDVTVDQLNAANANTKGYTNFIVGVKIIIPAKEGCTG